MICQKEIPLIISPSCLNWDDLQWNGAVQVGTGTFAPLAGQSNTCDVYVMTDGIGIDGGAENTFTPATLNSDGQQCHCRMTVMWSWTGIAPNVGLAILLNDGVSGTFGGPYTRTIANPNNTYTYDFYIDNNDIPFVVDVVAVINATTFGTAGDATARISFSVL